MTFGYIKSAIENNLVESYNDATNFKKTLKEFKQNILQNKNFSKVYSLYDDLTKPQGLSQEDAELYLNEGIGLIRHLLETFNLPKTVKTIKNNYQDIDNLVYFKNINLVERIESKKSILNNLTLSNTTVKESIVIPLKSMVGIANQTISNYFENLDESTKKEVFHILASKPEELEAEFSQLKESTVTKLQNLLEKEEEIEMKEKLTETIEKIKIESFEQMNYVRLKQLEQSIALAES